MSDWQGRPRFRYHPNLYELDILEHFEGACECCGRAGDTFYQGMYTTEDVDYVCLECIATGRAAERFHGYFNTGVPRIDNPEATDELLHRTPGYVSWQEGDWMTCCGDYCAYLGPVGTEELEEMGIADDLFEADGSLDGWESARGHGQERLVHRSPLPVPPLREVPPEGGRGVRRIRGRSEAMDIGEFDYLWTTRKDDFVLVEGEYGYAIVNRRERAVLHIEDEEVDAAVVARMLEEGCAVYGDILEACSDARG